jgi:acetyltransferase-like isoleucine patch superfamily enzyme
MATPVQSSMVGDGLVRDDGVTMNYRSGRSAASEALVLGHRARLRSGTVLYEGTRIGNDFETGHHVIVREDSIIGDEVLIWSNSVVDYGCLIGNRVKIHSNCYIAQFTEIRDDAFLAPGVMITNDLYPGRDDSAEAMRGPIIEEGAQIGANVTLLPFVRVGAGALVGAGSVVTKNIPAGMVAYGCPAVPVRAVAELEPIVQRLKRVDTVSWRLPERGESQ